MTVPALPGGRAALPLALLVLGVLVAGAVVSGAPAGPVLIGVAATSFAGTVVAVLRERPRARGWVLLGPAVALWTVGVAVALPPVRLVAVVLMAVSIASMTGPAPARRHPTATLDALIVAVGLGALVWVALLGVGMPAPGDESVDPVGSAVEGAPAAAAVVLLALTARLAAAPGLPTVRALLLGGGSLAVLVAEVAGAVPRAPAAVAPAAVMAAVAFAAAALHPTAGRGVHAAGHAHREARLVGAALLVVPALLVAPLVAGAGPQVWTVAVVATVLAALVVVRMHRVARWSEAAGRAATTDLTTGLPSRPGVESSLVRMLAVHAGVTVLALDLDRFSDVNATFGHDVGDRALQAVGRLIAGTVQAPGVVAGRLGGDEFVVLLPCSDVQASWEAARDLRRAFGSPVEVDGLGLRLEVAIGVATAPRDGTEPAVLLRRADVALARAKRERARVAWYEERTDSRATLGGSLAKELVEAIEGDRLRLHVQPILAMPGRQVLGIEALVRWAHPEHGLLGPDSFVPAAERTGSIGLLTRWVLDRALATVAGLREQAPELRVSVNLSATSLRDHQVVRDVRDALARHGLPGDALRLEVTETAAMADPERAMDVLLALTDVGVGLALDDYGTGYCSLAYLQRLPVDELKLDRTFVGRMSEHEPSEAIVRSTIDLGHRLGLSVVAEGVEDEETLAMLDSMGCRTAQGFGLGRPVPAERAAAALAGWAVPSRGAGGPRHAADPRATGAVGAGAGPSLGGRRAVP